MDTLSGARGRIDLSGKAALVTGAAASLPNALFQRADVARPEDCRALVGRAVSAWGGLDILVNNAGLQHVAPVQVMGCGWTAR